MTFPNDMKFRFPWRAYQARVLEELFQHIEDDNKLHIIAPPGSGKTVLGLEVSRRLNQPTLVLAPNLTIRNQWSERLIKDFLDNNTPDWISFDIKNPKFLTISTYQAMHAAVKADVETLTNSYKTLNFKTLVVDECHHLQREWWLSLMQLVKSLNPTIVALTATPPYDVGRLEWQRYNELCGTVDAEINVGELVAEKNLCPHQDYIYFSQPTEEEAKDLYRFHQKMNDFKETMHYNRYFIDLVRQHPFLAEPEANEKAIHENFAYFSSMLIYLNWTETSIPLSVWEMVGEELDELPEIDDEWLEILLNGVFFKDEYFTEYLESDDMKLIRAKLRKLGALEQQRLKLTNPKQLDNKLKSSASKIQSIKSIVEAEYKTLQQDLRMVILTDFIRKEAMPKNEFEVTEIDKIGVVPIFELVRRHFPIKIEVGILTGTLVVIPKFSEQQFRAIAEANHVSRSEIRTTTLPHDENYIQVEFSSKHSNKLVNVVTELFANGGLTVLVGTKSLLGEGWDAPAINSLILATFVGSYVLSNQMRGRAIRIQRDNPNKTGNIWHLVCLDPIHEKGGNDYETLQRRFKAFYGVSFENEPTLENGIDRFFVPKLPLHQAQIKTLNNKMITHASNRQELQLHWQKALTKGLQMREEIQVPKPINEKKYQKRQSKVVAQIDKAATDIRKHFSEILNYSLILAILGSGLAEYFGVTDTVGRWLMTFIIVAIIPFQDSIKQLFRAAKEINQQWFSFILLKSLFPIVLFIAFGITSYLLASHMFTLAVVAAFIIFSVSGVMTKSRFEAYLTNVINKKKLNQRYLNASWQMEDISETTLSTLDELKLLDTPIEELNVNIDTKENAFLECYLEGGTAFDEHLFMSSLNEAITMVDNHRYIIEATADIFGEYDEPKYFTVPEVFGRKKAEASTFFKHWQSKGYQGKLIYTRTFDGRKKLIKAKMQALGEKGRTLPKRISAWK